ncbi:type I pantothenate kinase [Serratia symbiotica str. 'Cinara cedri']|nr:type I pantothenate kinase [Serratia symbiotica str. 'Cinara cedri']
MIKRNQSLSTPYIKFNRTQWTALQESLPLTISDEEIITLRGMNADLSLEEVIQIYLPLSRLLNFYISSNLQRQTVINRFLKTKEQKIPYVIGIAGSVAVGKSTTARLLQILLSKSIENHKVELITTDSFLHPNKILNERGLMQKKGFPQSYDMRSMVKFISDVKSGTKHITAPIYSHLIYDIVLNGYQIIKQPDILIIEGLNILQSGIVSQGGVHYPHNQHRVFVSDFVDFSIYIDASETLLQNWYIHRFLKFCQGAFSNPNSYFHNYSKLPESKAVNIATQIWNNINRLNLKKNILPTRERASLIINKSTNHAVESMRLRK